MARAWGIPNPDDLLTYRSGTYRLMIDRLVEEAEKRKS